ncbi:RcnB family protein [Pseudoxanthomonas sangjuensis]|uniref:RcnB family protein n=1 Tax=Pseudoxanthomonas sangjuensis TaxID=1503750 RepID=UPI001390CCCA|nr:RcnB family protein [Pseudoxanthomonas sangjuensis]KAF1708296.1 hypothetical protein CSC71_11690 [Pseudoxanthomonas sangjuensis]
MKNLLKTVVSSVLLLGMASAPAFAGDHGRGHGRGHDRGGWSHQRDHRGDRDYRRDYRHDYRHDHYRGDRVVYRPVYVRPRPAYYAPRTVVVHRPAPYWARGGYYYGPGYAPTYVVNDWGYYGLRRPPHGYYWRRSDAGDFLLVALATGIIADVILNH